MKNINKSNAMELVGKEIVNVKNNVIGVVVRELDGKYTVDVNGEEKAYSLNTLIRNWKINENETEEIDEVVLAVEEGVQEIETEEITNEDAEIETEETANELNEKFEIETENRGIIDNIKETEGKVKITGHLYGVPVKFDKINQTTVWKTLNRLYDNRENTEDEYLLDDKKYLVQLLQKLDTEVFNGAFRCLKSKVKQNYIEELMK